MDFLIADTFTQSLGALTAEEQKSVKTSAFDLQMDPASPGMQLHRLERPKDPNFWSVRVNRDVRIIVHRTKSSLLLCYAGHHDDAYAWAERRKIERHPVTGAAQLVEIRETVREIVIPRYVEEEVASEPPKFLFGDVPEEALLSYGVPREWVAEIRDATEATLFDLIEHLPKEAGEALLDLAVGETPRPAPTLPSATDPFEHPDAQRRFRIVANREELERALEAPWETWAVFLHPDQRQLVERDFGGAARISGSAGTGKTIVALHRAAHLARANHDARVLLTTFSEPLANVLRSRLRLLVGNEPRVAERVEVSSLPAVARRLYQAHFGAPVLAGPDQIGRLLGGAAASLDGQKFTPEFLWTEWSTIVDAWQLRTWEDYREVRRLGRKRRLPEGQRLLLWSIFDRVRAALDEEGLVTEAEVLTRLAERLTEIRRPPFDFIVVDEAQDVSVPELRLLAALGAGRPNALFFTGDLGQRIFQQPFSWKSLGIDIRGRSSRLRINYRTSHQIRSQADRLLPRELADVDGVAEERGGTISVFDGPPPAIAILESEEQEIERVANWLRERTAEGLRPDEIALFVRSQEQFSRAERAARRAGTPFIVLDETITTRRGHLSIGTMHLAKGLEFRAVAVVACDEDVLPLQSRIESISDESDLDDVYATERHLFYVACTRARDQLLITGTELGSEFLGDLSEVRT